MTQRLPHFVGLSAVLMLAAASSAACSRSGGNVELIGSGSNGASSVKNIAELKVAATGGPTCDGTANATGNCCILVQGYYKPGDGGGGQFCWNDGTASGENDATIVKSEIPGTGRWHRTWSGALNLRWFGAVEWDGSDGTDSFGKLRAALDVLKSTGGGALDIPPGNFLVRTGPERGGPGPLVIDASNVAIRGAGAGATTLTIKDSPDGLLVGGPSAPDIEGVSVRDLKMTATWRPPDTSSVGASMLACAGCTRTSFRDLVLDTCGTTAVAARDGAKQFTLMNTRIYRPYNHGIALAGVSDAVVDDVYIESPRYYDGVSANPHAITVGIQITKETPNLMISNARVLLTATDTSGVGVDDTAFGPTAISNLSVTITNTNQNGIAAASKGPLVVSNLVVDGGAGYTGATAVALKATSAGSSYGMEINGAHITGKWMRSPVNMGFNKDSTFRNIVIDDGGPGYGIDLQSAITPTVEGCRVLAGSYGITLGNTKGARVRNNRISVTGSKYDASGAMLSDFVIEDADSGSISVASDYVVSASDRYLGVDTTMPRSISLGYAARFPSGAVLVIKDETGSAATNNVSLSTVGGDRFEDNTILHVLSTPFGVVRLTASGTRWLLL